MTFQFNWSPETLFKTLPIMGYGMLGIFVVMAVFYLTIVILLKIFNRKKGNPE